MKKITNKRIIFIDLDGTLLDIRKDLDLDISETNLKAFHALEKRGILPVISTGRAEGQAKRYLKKTKAKYIVEGNGSKILDSSGKIIHEEVLEKNAGEIVFEIAKKHDLLFLYNGTMTFQGTPNKDINKWMGKSRFTFESEYTHFPEKAYKLGIYSLENEDQQNVIAELIKAKLPTANILKMKYPLLSLEITSEKASKGLGNKWLAEHLGFNDPTTWAHIGDSMNDLSTAKYMDLFAMGNSHPKVKEAATLIGDDYKNGGLAKILDKIV